MKCKIHLNLLGQNEQYSPFSEGNKVTTGSEDFIDTEPQDADNRKSVLTSVAGYIIVTEFCERLAYYGFAGSLVLFLQVITKSLITCVYTIPNIHTYACMYAERVQLLKLGRRRAVLVVGWVLLRDSFDRWIHRRHLFGQIQDHPSRAYLYLMHTHHT